MAYNAALDTSKAFSLGSQQLAPAQKTVIKTATPTQVAAINKAATSSPQVQSIQSIAASVPQTTSISAAPKSSTSSYSSGGSSSGSYSAPKQISGTPNYQVSAATQQANAAQQAALLAAQNQANQAAQQAAQYKAQMENINALAAAQEKAKLAALEASKNTAISALNKEKGAIDPAYYAQKNQAAIQNQQGINNFQEFLASRGLRRSGTAAGNISEQAANLQGTLGTLSAQQQAAIDDIASRASQIQANNASAIAEAQGTIQAQKIQNLIDQANKNREYDLNAASLTGYLNEKNTLARDQYLTNTGLSEAELTMDYKKLVSDLKSAQLAQRGQELENVQQAISNKYLSQEKQSALDMANANLTGQQLQNVGQEIANKMKNVDMSYYSEVQKANYDKLVNEVQSGDIENAMNDLQLANLPEELKQKIANSIADTASKYSNIDVNNAQIQNILANTANTQKSTALMGTSSGKSGSGGSSGTKKATTTQINDAYNNMQNEIKNLYWSPNEDTGKITQSAQERRDMINYVVGEAMSGTIPDEAISRISTKYNITSKDFDDVMKNGQSTYGQSNNSSSSTSNNAAKKYITTSWYK